MIANTPVTVEGHTFTAQRWMECGKSTVVLGVNSTGWAVLLLHESEAPRSFFYDRNLALAELKYEVLCNEVAAPEIARLVERFKGFCSPEDRLGNFLAILRLEVGSDELFQCAVNRAGALLPCAEPNVVEVISEVELARWVCSNGAVN